MVIKAAADRRAAMELVASGDIRGAVAILRAAADASNDPEDCLFLGRLAFVATDYGEAQKQLEHAFREFRARDLPRRAALAAAALANVFFDGLDEQVIAQGWRARALRLLEHEGPCVEKGYALLAPTGASVASAEELEANARTALELAQRFKDHALECKALADSGLALVSMGRLAEGLSRLDEAFTMIIGGEVADPGVISQAICAMLSACDRTGDLMRAETWARFVEKRAADDRVAAIHTFSHCWSAFGSVLCQVGRWTEAETALRTALARGDHSFHINRLQTRAALAELWTRQGRLDEAARLIDHSVDRVEVMGPRARLYLAQGRYEGAAAVARNALRKLSGDRLRATSLLGTLVDAELAQGNIADAEKAAAQMGRLAESAETPLLIAEVELALGRIASASGEAGVAAQHFDAGLAALPDESWPLVRAALHVALARARLETAPSDALVHAEEAFSIYHRIGAPELSTAAELLQQLGASVAPTPATPSALDVLSRREREVLSLLAEGSSNPEIGERLFISAKTAEHHVGAILRKLGLKNRAEAAAFAVSFRISGDTGMPAAHERFGRK